MLINREAFEKGCGALRAEDFSKVEHRIIFAAMQNMFRKNIPCDNVTLMDALGADLQTAGGIAYITELSLTVPSGANAARYIQSVMEQSSERRLRDGLQAVLDEMNTGDDADHVAAAQDVIDGVRATGSGTVAPVGGDFLIAAARIGDRNTGLSTGFLVLDVSMGGLKPGHMTVVGARPSMGKTALATNIAVAAALSSKTVAVFSLEMSREDVLQRAVISRSLCSEYDVRMRELSAVKPLLAAAEELSRVPLYVLDDVITVDAIKSRCYAIRQQASRLDLIVIDYLGLIQGKGKSKDRVSEVSEISRNVKLMAKELNVPVLILSQLSRSPELRADHRPVLSDLRDSGSIEQDADEVLLLYRPAVYDQNADSKEAIVTIAKNRNGRTGDCSLLWDGEHFRFYEQEIDFDAIEEGEQLCM